MDATHIAPPDDFCVQPRYARQWHPLFEDAITYGDTATTDSSAPTDSGDTASDTGDLIYTDSGDTSDSGGDTTTSTAGGSEQLLFNENLADPGPWDANCDGLVDTSDDEFVEIINRTDTTVDLSAATLLDAVGVRHVFTDGTARA